MRKTSKRSDCPISSALDLLGDKWTLLIVRDLMFRGKTSFRDFLESGEGIATNILTDRLARLLAFGIVEKHEVEGRPRGVYRLTGKGVDLMPVLLEVVAWSDKYLDISERGRGLAEQFRRDRQGLMARIKSRLVPAEGPIDESLQGSPDLHHGQAQR